MPDTDLQELYNEANRRGLLKKDPDLQKIGHELRARKIIADPTQGGIATPAVKAPSSPAQPVNPMQARIDRDANKIATHGLVGRQQNASMSAAPEQQEGIGSKLLGIPGKLLSIPKGILEAAVMLPIDRGLHKGLTPEDKREMERVAELPLPKRIEYLMNQPINAPARPYEQSLSNVGKARQSPLQKIGDTALNFGGEMATDPATWLAGAGLLSKGGKLAKGATLAMGIDQTKNAVKDIKEGIKTGDTGTLTRGAISAVMGASMLHHVTKGVKETRTYKAAKEGYDKSARMRKISAVKLQGETKPQVEKPTDTKPAEKPKPTHSVVKPIGTGRTTKSITEEVKPAEKTAEKPVEEAKKPGPVKAQTKAEAAPAKPPVAKAKVSEPVIPKPGSTEHAIVGHAADSLDVLDSTLHSRLPVGSPALRGNYETARETMKAAGIDMPELQGRTFTRVKAAIEYDRARQQFASKYGPHTGYVEGNHPAAKAEVPKPVEVKAQPKPSEEPILPEQPSQLETIAESVKGKAGEKGFIKAADMYAEAKKANPKLTKVEFAEQLHELHKSDKYEYQGPSGNAKPADIFTHNGVRYFGFSGKPGKLEYSVNKRPGTVNPKFQGESPAKPNYDRLDDGEGTRLVARGKKALTDRLGLEHSKGNIDLEVHTTAKKFINSLPDKFIDDLASSYFKGRIPGTPEAAGAYDPVKRLVEVSKELLHNQTEPERVIPHEVAHHLEKYVDREDLSQLEKEYQRAKKVADRKNLPANEAYRFKDVKEFFAESIADRGLRDAFADNLTPKNRTRFQKIVNHIKTLAQSAVRFLRGEGKEAAADKIYRKLLSGEYSDTNKQAEAYRNKQKTEASRPPLWDWIDKKLNGRVVDNAKKLSKFPVVRNYDDVPEQLPDTLRVYHGTYDHKLGKISKNGITPGGGQATGNHQQALASTFKQGLDHDNKYGNVVIVADVPKESGKLQDDIFKTPQIKPEYIRAVFIDRFDGKRDALSPKDLGLEPDDWAGMGDMLAQGRAAASKLLYSPFSKAVGAPQPNITFTQGLSHAIRNSVLEGASHLKAGNRAVYEAGTELAGARTYADRVAKDYLPKVLAPLDPVERSSFQLYHVADRALSELDAMQGEYKKLNAELTTAKPEEIDALRKKIRTVKSDIDNNIMNRANDPMIDPNTGNPITEDMVKQFMSRPNVVKANTIHEATVEPFLERNYTASGKTAAGDRGKYGGRFVPAIAIDENGVPISHGSGPSGGNMSPIMELPSVPGARRFSGTSKAYSGDYTLAHKLRFRSGFRSAAAYNFVKEFTDSGDMVPANDTDRVRNVKMGNTVDGIPQTRTEIKLKNGKWVAASNKFSVQDSIFGSKEVGAKYSDLPTDVYVPEEYHKEIRPLFANNPKATAFEDTTQHLTSTNIAMNLIGVGEAGAHGRGLASRLGKMIPAVRGVGEGLQTKGLTVINSALQGGKMLGGIGHNLMHSDTDRMEASKEAALAGALPSKFGLAPEQGDNLAIRASKFTGKLLYGEKGALSNAHTTIYKYFRDSGLLDKSRADYNENVAAMRDMMREMNTHTQFLASDITRNRGPASSLISTYAQTGVRNRMAAYRGGAGAYLQRATGMLLLTAALTKARDPKHRWPNEIPGYTPGDVFIEKDKDGRNITLNLVDWMDRTQGLADYHLRSVMKSLSVNDPAPVVINKLLMATANQAIAPVAGGPAPAVLSELTGKSPYFLPGNADQWELGSTPDAKGTNKQRLINAAKALVPFVKFGDIDTFESSKPKDPSIQQVNRILAMVGQVRMKSSSERGVLTSAHSKARRYTLGQKRAEAKERLKEKENSK